MALAGEKLEKSLETLKEAIDFFNNVKDDKKDIAFLSVAKAFEVSVEYAWRELKNRVEDEGLDAPSPKAAIREAARIGLIENAEAWIDFINARNAGVHDYFGMPEDEYVKIANEFLVKAKKVFK